MKKFRDNVAFALPPPHSFQTQIPQIFSPFLSFQTLSPPKYEETTPAASAPPLAPPPTAKKISSRNRPSRLSLPTKPHCPRPAHASPTASSLAPRRLTSSSPSSTTTSSDSSQKLSRLSFSLHRLQLLASSCSPPLRSSSPSYHPPPLQPSIAKPEPLSPFRHHHHPFPASVTKKSASSPNFQTHLFRRFDSPFIFQIHRIHHTDSPPISSSASSHLLKSQIHINHPPLTGATSRESTGTCFGVRLPSSNNPGVNSDLLPPTAFRNHLQSVASCHRCFEP